MRDILSDLKQDNLLSDPDPVRRAQIQMKAPLIKRFYASVDVIDTPEGFVIHLDGKPVRTPAKSVMLLPTRKAAQLVANEFAAQGDHVLP